MSIPQMDVQALPARGRDSVSLIALAYNHAGYLPQLFSSIDSNLSDIGELIFIDNGSSDNSAELMQTYLQNASTRVAVRMFRNPPRTGPTHAVNIALHAATCDFVAVTSGDDYLLANRFTAQLSRMRTDPTAQFCYSNGYVCGADGVLTNVPVHGTSTIELLMRPPSAISAGLYYPVPTLFTQCALFKRSALLEVGGWDEDLVIDDWPLNLKLFKQFGYGFRFVDAFVAAYRRHDSNASKRRFRQYMGQKRVLLKYAEGLNLSRGLFALLAAQALASLRRREWTRAKVFWQAAFSCKAGIAFIVYWFANETRRRLNPNQIR